MNAAEYRAAMAAAEAAARSFVLGLADVGHAELQAAALVVERADSAGSILDPTAWREQNARAGLERQRELVRATIDYRNALVRVFPEEPLLRRGAR